MAPAFNPSVWKAETEGSLWVRGQQVLQRDRYQSNRENLPSKKKKKSGPSDHVFTQIVICSKRLSQWREEHPLPPGVVEQWGTFPEAERASATTRCGGALLSITNLKSEQLLHGCHNIGSDDNPHRKREWRASLEEGVDHHLCFDWTFKRHSCLRYLLFL